MADLKDLTPGPNDVPPFSLGGQDDYAISPDSNEVAFAMNVDPDPATSTNSDIYVVPIGGGDVKKDHHRSRRGQYAAVFAGRKIPGVPVAGARGYESDRWRLMVLDRATGRATSLTENLDRWVGSVTWSPDSTRLFFTVEDRGRTGLQMIQATGGGSRNIIAGASTLDDVQFTSDGRTMIYTEVSGSHPAEIYRATSSGGAGVPLTHLNDAVLSNAAITPLEEMYADSSDKTRVHAFVVKPPDFSPTKKYPGAVPDSRRAARIVGRIVDLPLERPGVRRRGISGGDAESARLHRLRPEIYRGNQRRLGRQSLRRHHGGGG